MKAVRELWRYRELFYFLALRDVKLRYKQTALGVVWVLIQPLFTMVVFTFLFGNLAKLPSDGTPHAVFYLSALLPWTYFSTVLAGIGNSLVSNANLLTKVYFPRIILPASVALAGLLDLLIGSICLVGVMAYFRLPPAWPLLFWPLLLVPLVCLTLGVGAFLAALNVRYRDIKYALPFVIQIWLFLTPIIYPASMVPGRFRVLLALNPLSGLIEAFRFCVAPARPMDWEALAISLGVTAVTLAVGLAYFRKTEQAFADIV
jgi:lipopolysaccharide transport system permease protein